MDEKEKARLEAEAAAKKKAEEDAKLAKEAADKAEIEAALAKEAQKDEEIKKLTEERDNYREVALKRLGKLPADSKFLGDEGKEITSIIEDRVKAALIDEEIARKQREKDENNAKLTKENAELRLALKNRPGSPIGGGGGDNDEKGVKDNVLSETQIAQLKEKAKRLKVKDVDAFIDNFKKNLGARR